MNQDFFSKVGSFKLTDASLRSDNDFLDRLNYYYTTIIIVIFAVVVSAKQYVGRPLQCWIPAEFSDQWEKYAENYCWIKNTYFVPMNETSVPEGVHSRRQHEINYYQYVPFILALMALGCNIPNVVWKILNHRTGVNIKSTVQFASSIIRSDPNDRTTLVQKLAADLKDKIGYQMDDKNRKSYLRGLKTLLSCFTCRSINSFGSFLTFSYLVTKVLFCLNSIGLLLAVSCMLTSSYRVFNFASFQEILSGKGWRDTGIFPRVTHCDFEIRRLNVRHPYSIQCVLMINLFNEKIFMFLWFWFLVISFGNLCSFMYWLLHLLPFQQKGFVQNYLLSCEQFSTEEIQENIDDFVDNHLKNDGIFMLRLIASNSGHMVTTELVERMWTDRYHGVAQSEGSTEPSAE